MGIIADCVRHPSVYVEKARGAGLGLVENKDLLPSEYLMSELIKYREFSDTAISHMLVFEKK